MGHVLFFGYFFIIAYSMIFFIHLSWTLWIIFLDYFFEIPAISLVIWYQFLNFLKNSLPKTLDIISNPKICSTKPFRLKLLKLYHENYLFIPTKAAQILSQEPMPVYTNIFCKDSSSFERHFIFPSEKRNIIWWHLITLRSTYLSTCLAFL